MRFWRLLFFSPKNKVLPSVLEICDADNNCYISRDETRTLLLKMNSLTSSLYKTNDDAAAQLNVSTYPDVIHNKNKLSHIAIWGLLFKNVMLNENLYNHVLSCHKSIASIQDGRKQLFVVLLKSKSIKNYFFSLKLAYHEVYFSAAWCNRSLLYDQTI